MASLLPAAIGAPWLIYESRKLVRKNRAGSGRDKGYYFALASVIAALMGAALVCLAAFASTGLLLTVLGLALWVYCVRRVAPTLRRLRDAEYGSFNPTPFYLVIVPAITALVGLSLIGRAAESSRRLAISNSAELIQAIEGYHDANGRYPASFLALNGDYRPSVIETEQYYYSPEGAGYNLYFEQMSTDLGAREHDTPVPHWKRFLYD